MKVILEKAYRQGRCVFLMVFGFCFSVVPLLLACGFCVVVHSLVCYIEFESKPAGGNEETAGLPRSAPRARSIRMTVKEESWEKLEGRRKDLKSEGQIISPT